MVAGGSNINYAVLQQLTLQQYIKKEFQISWTPIQWITVFDSYLTVIVSILINKAEIYFSSILMFKKKKILQSYISIYSK